VPVRGDGGALTGMVGFSGPSERLDRAALVAPLHEAAAALA
jgi:hypothetical protein